MRSQDKQDPDIKELVRNLRARIRVLERALHTIRDKAGGSRFTLWVQIHDIANKGIDESTRIALEGSELDPAK